MSWNVTELQSKIRSLESRIKEVKDQNSMILLENDLYNLKQMVNYKLGRSVYDNHFSGFKIIDKDHFEAMVQMLQANGNDIFHQMHGVALWHHVPIKGFLNSKIPNDVHEEMLLAFLEYFDKNLLSLYKRYKEENRIEINQAPYESLTCTGKCYPIASEGSTYISSRYNGRFNRICNIPHELGHAYQFSKPFSATEFQRRLYSLFGEAYPIFIEFAFLDFLKNTKYHKAALKQKGEILNNYLCNIEYNVSGLCEVPDAFYTSDGSLAFKGYGRTSEYNTLILSGMLGMHWYALYCQEPQKALSEISEFNKKFGQVSEESVLSHYGVDNLASGVYWTLDDYMKSYRKH